MVFRDVLIVRSPVSFVVGSIDGLTRLKAYRAWSQTGEEPVLRHRSRPKTRGKGRASFQARAIIGW